MLIQWFNEISNSNRDDVQSSDYLYHACDTFTHSVNSLRGSLNVRMQIKSKNKNNLSWFNENLWRLMKFSDAALRKAIKTRGDTDILIYKDLMNKVTQELRS